MKLSNWLQILTIVVVFSGIIFEIRWQAHWGYIFVSSAGYVWAISEKLRKKGR